MSAAATTTASNPRERLAFGAGWRDHGLVFTRPGGEPLNPEAVLLAFKRRAAPLGLPVIRSHDLRHGWATLALFLDGAGPCRWQPVGRRARRGLRRAGAGS